MAIFNLHKELNSFYEERVRLGQARRDRLAEYREACLQRLREGLEKLARERNKTYQPFIRSIGQGSYPMHTLNQHPRDEYDIDIAVIFEKDDLPTTALEARRRVADALLATGGNFRKKPEARTNAVTVWYGDGAHVDLAVYRRVPGFFSDTLEHAGPEWQHRDPGAVTTWFLRQVEERQPGFWPPVSEGQLRRVVRWVKAFCRSRASWGLPGGMIITALVVELYRANRNRDDVALYETIHAVLERLRISLNVANPVDSSVSLTSKPVIQAQMKALLEKLESAWPELAILEGKDCTRERALRAWRQFFKDGFWSEVAESDGTAGG